MTWEQVAEDYLAKRLEEVEAWGARWQVVVGLAVTAGLGWCGAVGQEGGKSWARVG